MAGGYPAAMTVEPAQILRPELRRLLQHWETARSGDGLPSRARFAPVDVADLLSHMLFVEVIGSRPRFRYREVGIELIRIYGSDFTDRHIDEMPRLFRTFAEPAYREVLSARGPTHGSFRFVQNWWIAAYERLMLPLVDEDGTICEVAVGIYPRFQRRDA